MGALLAALFVVAFYTLSFLAVWGGVELAYHIVTQWRQKRKMRAFLRRR